MCSGILCFRTQDWLLIPFGIKVLCQTYLITFIPSQGQTLYNSQLNNNRNWSDFIILFISSSVSFSLVFLVPVWMRKLETIQNKRKCFCFIQQIKKLRNREVKVFSWVHTPFFVEESGLQIQAAGSWFPTQLFLQPAFFPGLWWSILSYQYTTFCLFITYWCTFALFPVWGLVFIWHVFVYLVTAKLQNLVE